MWYYSILFPENDPMWIESCKNIRKNIGHSFTLIHVPCIFYFVLWPTNAQLYTTTTTIYYYYCVHRKSHKDRPCNDSWLLHQEVSKRVLVCHGSATAWRLHYESRAVWENTWQSVASALTLSTTSSAPSHIAKIINPVTKTHVATRMFFPNIPSMMSDSVAYVESESMKNWWVRNKPYV